MWIFLILALTLSLGVSQSGVLSLLDREYSMHTRESQRIVSRYRTFVFTAQQYMKAHSPGPNQVIGWDQIRESRTTPRASRQIHMPSNWYIQTNASGDYVICAALPEQAVASLRQLMPDEVGLHGVSEEGDNVNDKLVFAADAASASAEKDKCAI